VISDNDGSSPTDRSVLSPKRGPRLTGMLPTTQHETTAPSWRTSTPGGSEVRGDIAKDWARKKGRSPLVAAHTCSSLGNILQ
jgi:hypothetical protein